MTANTSTNPHPSPETTPAQPDPPAPAQPAPAAPAQPDPPAPAQPAPAAPARPPRKRRWLKWLLGCLVVLAVLLTGLYWYACSYSFFNSWVRPPIEKALGRSLMIKGYTFSPLGRVTLEDVEIGALPGESTPPLRMARFELRMSALALRGKRIEISRFFLDSLTIHIVQEADGTLRGPFPAIRPAAPAPAPKEKPAAAPPAKKEKAPAPPAEIHLPQLPFQLNLANIEIKNVNVLFDRYQKGRKEPDSFRVDGLSVTCPCLALDKNSDIKIAGKAAARVLPPPTVEAGAKPQEQNVGAAFDISMTTTAPKGKLSGMAASVALSDFQGRLQGEDLSRYALSFNPKVELDEATQKIQIPMTSLKVESGGSPLAQIDFSADWDQRAQTGQVAVEIHPMDRRVLNLAAASTGMDFRDTRVSGSTKAALGKDGLFGVLKNVQAALSVEKLNPTGGGLPASGFPATDLRMALEGGAETGSAPFVVRKLALDVAQQTAGGPADILSVSLKKPLSLDPATLMPLAGKVGDEALAVNVRDFDLAQWQSLLPAGSGVRFERGLVSAELSLGENPQKAESLNLRGVLRLTGLKGKSGDHAFGPISTRTDLLVGVDAKQNVDLRKCATVLQSGEKTLGTVALSGTISRSPLQGNVRLDATDLEPFAFPLSQLKAAKIPVEGGRVTASADITFRDTPLKVQARAKAQVSGMDVPPRTPAGKALKAVEVAFNTDTSLVMTGKGGLGEIAIQSLRIEATQSQKPLLQATAQGKMDLVKGQGKIQAECRNADLVPLLAWQGTVPAESMPLESKLQMTAEVAQDGPDVYAANGNLALKPLVIPNPADAKAGPVSLPVAIEFKQKADLGKKRIAVDLVQVRVEGSSSSKGQMKLTGNLSYGEPLSGKFQVRAEEFPLAPFVPFVASARKTADLSAAVLQCDQNVTLVTVEKKQSANLQGGFEVAGIRPAGEKNKQAPPMRVALTNEIAYEAPNLNLKTIHLQVAHGKDQPDQMDVTGRLKFASAPTGEIKLVSKSLNLKPLLAYADVTPAPDAPALRVGNLGLLMVMTPQGIEMKDLALEIAGGKFTCPSFVVEPPKDKAGPGQDPLLRWKDVKGAGFDVDTLIANCAAKYRGYVKGKASIETFGSAKGFTEEAMRQNLRAELRANVTDGEILDVPIFQELAAVTTLNDLRRIVFTHFDSEYLAGEKGIEVKRVDIVGEPQKIHLDGRIGYDQKLDLPMTLALGGSLKKSVEKQNYAQYLKKDADGYVGFPMPLAVGGTMAKPKIKIDFPKEVLIDTGMDLLKNRLDKEFEKEKKKQEKKQEKKSGTPGQQPSQDKKGLNPAQPQPGQDKATTTPAQPQPGQDKAAATPAQAKKEQDSGKKKKKQSDKEKALEIGRNLLEGLGK